MSALFYVLVGMLCGGLCAGHFRVRRVPDFPVDQPAYSPPPLVWSRGEWAQLQVRSFTMVKITPNPPRAESLSAYTTLDTKKLREAADRALNVHLSDRKSTRLNSSH